MEKKMETTGIIRCIFRLYMVSETVNPCRLTVFFSLDFGYTFRHS